MVACRTESLMRYCYCTAVGFSVILPSFVTKTLVCYLVFWNFIWHILRVNNTFNVNVAALGHIKY
jgi:hypothetical protein